MYKFKVLKLGAIGLTALTLGIGGVSAQNATPGTQSPLASLGLPELHVVVTDAGIQAPAEVAAGLTYVTLDNQTNSDTDAQLGLPPAGVTLDQIAQDIGGDGFSDWFYQSTFVGGAYAYAHDSGSGVVDLSAGNWVIATTDTDKPVAPVALKVTGDAAAQPGAVKSDLTVTEKGYTFDFPDQVAAGPKVWEVRNEDPVPHMIVVERYPGKVTDKDVQDIFAAEMGTPVPDMAINPDDFQEGTYVPVLSKGETSWVDVNLEPGTYVALCFVSDEGSQVPHAAMGMFDIFTVPGDSGTPTS